MGYAFSPALVSQEQASSILTRWLQIFSTAAVWSGGLLKFIPYADTAISAGAGTNLQHAAFDSGSDPSVVRCVAPGAGDGRARQINSSRTAASFTLSPTSRSPSSAIRYRAPPGLTAWRSRANISFGPADEGKPVVITYTAGAAADFTPNLAPVYALTDLDFIDEKGNKDPVQVERADVFSLPTIQRVEVLSRGNQYSAPSRSKRATKARSRFSARASAQPFRRTRSATSS